MKCACKEFELCRAHYLLSDLQRCAKELRDLSAPRLAIRIDQVLTNAKREMKGTSNEERPNLSKQISQGR